MMQVAKMKGRVLDHLVTICLPDDAVIDPQSFIPSQNPGQIVGPFFVLPKSGIYRIEPSKAKRPNCVGEGAFEARAENYYARGDSPVEAICRVLIYRTLGTSVDVPNKYKK